MPTSPTDPSATLLLFAAGDGAIERWLLHDGTKIIWRGEGPQGLPRDPQRTLLIVPGEQVATHWLELAEGLAPAQSAAAARLMLAGASAEPLAQLHLALGPAEAGRTPAALVSRELMQAWLGNGLAIDAIVPSPWLLSSPAQGFVRRDRGEIADYRAAGAAFSLERELAAPALGESDAAQVDDAAFEAGLAAILSRPMLDLRQGEYAMRRRWRLDTGANARRLGYLGLALVLLTLAVQIASILAYTFAADQAEEEARQLAAGASAGQTTATFGALASPLFDAIRSTPNAELSRLEYRSDGRASVTVLVDTPATLAALQARLEAGGLRAVPGATGSAGGRPATELTLTRS